MGVAVLHPQHSLPNKPSSHYQTIIPHFPNMNPKSNRTSRNRKKRPVPGPHDVPGLARLTTSMKSQVNNNPPPPPQQQQLVMGQVKILKRGELLTQTTLDPQTQTESVEKKTETVEKKGLTSTVEGLYAGYSMLVMSPPPSSVPLPAFITKKFAALSDATSDLREMLRLDFP